jgi:hypothetical protein
MPTIITSDLTFIHVPKTGGQSISKWLNDYVPINETHHTWFDDPTYHHSTPMIKDITRYTCAVVRNPWDRTVSLWSFWNKMYPYISFESFIKNMKTEKFAPCLWYTLGTPQKHWIPNGVTHLIYFEDIENEFKKIQTHYNCFEPLEKINSTEHTYYKKYYTPELVKTVYDIFKQDIDEYGYKF